MHIDYTFVPENRSAALKHKSDIVSYAGKLLEIVGSRTLLVGLDNYDKPFIYQCEGRLVNALDFEFPEE